MGKAVPYEGFASYSAKARSEGVSRQRVFQRVRAAMGLCDSCARKAVVVGRCETHRVADNASQMARYYRRTALGLCGWCRRISDGHALCPRCRTKKELPHG